MYMLELHDYNNNDKQVIDLKYTVDGGLYHPHFYFLFLKHQVEGMLYTTAEKRIHDKIVYTVWDSL